MYMNKTCAKWPQKHKKIIKIFIIFFIIPQLFFALLAKNAIIFKIPPSVFLKLRVYLSQNKCQNEGRSKSPGPSKGRS